MKMDRRKTLKTLLVGSLASGAAMSGCNPQTGGNDEQALNQQAATPGGGYGRTPEEIEQDQLLASLPSPFTEEELGTLAIVADIILPADQVSGSATDAGVVEFISYIVKEMDNHFLPVRSGIAWMDRESHNRFEKNFSAISEAQRIEIIEDIAYPFDAEPQYASGARLFSHIRNLVMTGFYTSEEGIKDLGYDGNRTNFWDGVPEEVLAKHGFSYDPEMMDKYITLEKREVVAQWDDNGNLIYPDQGTA